MKSTVERAKELAPWINGIISACLDNGNKLALMTRADDIEKECLAKDLAYPDTPR